MFELSNAIAHIRSVNLRIREHGPEEVPCADLKIETRQPNGMLSEFGPQLRDALYLARTADGDQGKARWRRRGERQAQSTMPRAGAGLRAQVRGRRLWRRDRARRHRRARYQDRRHRRSTT